MFEKKGVAFVGISCGEAERSILDYGKHYRSGAVHLVSADYRITSLYNAGSWPTTAVIDREGVIRFHAVGAFLGSAKTIQTLLEGLSAAGEEKGSNQGSGEEGPPKEKKGTDPERECFPRIAVSANGGIFLTYSSNRTGNNDIYLLEHDGEKWLPEKAVTQEACDDYGSAVLVDSQNRAWISWCSNGAGKYNICARSFNKGRFSEIYTLTRSVDDAMYPSLASDTDGNVWVTYYKWTPWGFLSRDREVYARFFQNGRWSKEIRISPEEVPQYEDHADPVAVADPSGGIAIAWSWDYHPSKETGGYEAAAPTIFLRRVKSSEGSGKVEAIHLIGTQAKNRSAIDLSPSVEVDGTGRIWVLWDSFQRESRYVIAKPLGEDESEILLGGPYQQICSPRLLKVPGGPLSAVWAARKDQGDWQIYRCKLNGEEWADPEAIPGTSGARYADGAFDGKGRLWLAMVKRKGEGSKVEVIQVPG